MMYECTNHIDDIKPKVGNTIRHARTMVGSFGVTNHLGAL